MNFYMPGTREMRPYVQRVHSNPGMQVMLSPILYDSCAPESSLA